MRLPAAFGIQHPRRRLRIKRPTIFIQITEKEFLDRMKLESISIQPEGAFEFYHRDGNLFYGHSIQISGSLEKGLTHSDIPG